MLLIKWLSYINGFLIINICKIIHRKKSIEQTIYKRFFSDGINFQNWNMYMEHVKSKDILTYYITLSLPLFVIVAIITFGFALYFYLQGAPV